MVSEPNAQESLDATCPGLPRPLSKRLFLGVNSAVGIGISIAVGIVFGFIQKNLGVRLSQWLGPPVIPIFVLTAFLTDRIFKRMGLSRSGQIVEKRKRSIATPEGEVPDDEVLEISNPKYLLAAPLIGWVVGGVTYALLLHQVLWILISEYYIAFVLYVLFGVFSFYAWWRGPSIVRADSNGISAFSGPWSISQTFVPWSSVATCEIVSHHDTFGNRMLIESILKEYNGQTLLNINLRSTNDVDQDRLVAYIRAKLPKLHEDPWDWE